MPTPNQPCKDAVLVELVAVECTAKSIVDLHLVGQPGCHGLQAGIDCQRSQHARQCKAPRVHWRQSGSAFAVTKRDRILHEGAPIDIRAAKDARSNGFARSHRLIANLARVPREGQPILGPLGFHQRRY